MKFSEVIGLMKEGHVLLTIQKAEKAPYILKMIKGKCFRRGTDTAWERDNIETTEYDTWAERWWTLPVIYKESEEYFILEYGEQL